MSAFAAPPSMSFEDLSRWLWHVAPEVGGDDADRIVAAIQETFTLAVPVTEEGVARV